MTQSRTPLTYIERLFIETWIRGKRPYRWIGRQLGRHHTVIMREVRRNSGRCLPYTAQDAEQIIQQRLYSTRRRKIDRHEKLRAYIVHKLIKERWSPQDIAGRLKIRDESTHYTDGMTVSHESVYQWIYEGNGRIGGLYTTLHYRQRRRQPRYRRKHHHMPRIPDRTSIHDRPGIVQDRKRFGDWESDTMVFSKQSACLSVQYERKSRLVRMHKMFNRSANETREAITASIDSLSQGLFKTITFDNGVEGARHMDIAHEYALQTYFCDPYASWQKGGVENMNKWIRGFLPRTTNMEEITDDDIHTIQELLNNKPRKSLHFNTPNEILQQEILSGAYST